jgi:antitoxin VapB
LSRAIFGFLDFNDLTAYAKHMQKQIDIDTREVSLFRNGKSQAVRIPRDFELPGKTAIMRREGSKLIVEPTPKPDLLAVLAELAAQGPIEEEFPEIPDLPAEPVEL